MLETTFVLANGTVRMTDFMPVLDDSQMASELHPLRELVRVVEVLKGSVDLEFVFEPRPDYARCRPKLIDRCLLGWTCLHRETVLTLRSDARLELSGDGASVRGRASLVAGDQRAFSLAYDQYDIGIVVPLGADVQQRLEATLGWWQRWAGGCSYHGPNRDLVVRSAITLKTLTYAPSGAVVAAPTASLPESPGGARNWDYRYCWLRDAAFTFQVFSDLGFQAEGEAYLSWMLHTTRLTWPRLQVLYDIYGHANAPEQELAHLDGYRNSRPVRVGNAATGQLQLDVYGEVIHAASEFVRRGGKLDRFESKFLIGLGKTVCRRWREPDAGIWEMRGEQRHNTHSRLMCWVALDRLIGLHQSGHLDLDVEKLAKERTALRDAIEQDSFDTQLGGYVAAVGQPQADASLLLMARYGFHPPNHARMRGTYDFIRRTLERRTSLLLRYEAGSDDLSGSEGAFGICSFWAIEYLALCGERQEAMRRFEQMAGFANDVGLFAEEIDQATGAALGNFPQAFTHIGLIAAALALEKASKSVAPSQES